MDIQHIRYFLAVAKYQSFSKAADKLFVTQPILTRCVKTLEQELGVPLIVRSTRAFSLTDAGQSLVEYGTKLLQQHQDIYQHIQDVANSKTGEIRISCPGMLLDMYFPKLVTQYRSQFPGIHIYIQENGSRQVVEDVLVGSADIGLVMLPIENSEDLDIFPIVKDEVHVLVRHDHPFTGRAYVDISQLKETDIITYNKTNTLYNTFMQMCHDKGFSPTIVFQSMMPNFILDTIEYGSCVGIYPAPILQRFEHPSLVSIPLRPHFPWEIALITKKDRYISHAARSFLSFCQTFFSQLST